MRVQSVSINRAMQSSISSSQLRNGWGAVSASGVIENGGDGEEVVLTLAEKDREAEERAKNRRAMWARRFRAVQKFR